MLHARPVGLQLPCSFVLPLAWQRAAGTGPSSDQSRQRAAQLYPQSASQLSRKRDGGRADAILIARHGLQLVHQSRGITAASPPSMLPNPQPASESVYVVRLRIRLRSEMESRRRTERQNLRLRTEIVRLQSLLRKRACKLDRLIATLSTESSTVGHGAFVLSVRERRTRDCEARTTGITTGIGNMHHRRSPAAGISMQEPRNIQRLLV
jgi:hypothetical protein